ncbi:MAG: YqaE/Pmp3 family membrane protein [Hyphomicrobium sp.]
MRGARPSSMSLNHTIGQRCSSPLALFERLRYICGPIDLPRWNNVVSILSSRYQLGGCMRYVLALFLPWLPFFTMGKPLQGIFCLLLQITIIGWIPATIWSLTAIAGYHADKRTDKIVSAMKK